VATRKLIGLPLYNHHYVQAVAFSRDGKTAATASSNYIRVWDLPGSYEPAEVILPHENPVVVAAFSPDGRMVGTSSYSERPGRTQKDPPPSTEARLWDAATGKPLGDPLPRQLHQEHPLKVAFSPDGKTFAMLSEFWNFEPRSFGQQRYISVIHLWDVATHQPVGQPLEQKVDSQSSWAQGVEDLVFAADGKTLTATDLRGLIQVWDLASGKPVGAPQNAESNIPKAVSADGKRILEGHLGANTAHLSTATRETIGWLQHQGYVEAVAISPDGALLLTGSDDHTARLWDAATQKPLGPPLKHDGPVVVVAFSPDGKTILTASLDKTARLWRVPPVPEGQAEQVVQWLQVVTGAELIGPWPHLLDRTRTYQDGGMRPALFKYKQRLKELGGPPQWLRADGSQ
jgi:WD40 repeat protein